jgi:glycosyltransferase involved in cell wall biosynthesis
MRILTVVYCYPPILVPATMCYVKLVKGLKELGHDVEIVTIDHHSFDAPAKGLFDPTMERVIPDGVVNHVVWSWEANPFIKALKHFSPVENLLYRFFEPRKREWVFPALRQLTKLRLENYDAVLTCSKPDCNHLIGLELKRRTNIPWIAYLSDPWVDMPWQNYPSKRIAAYHLALETEVMTAADHILFTSEETRALVMSKYPTEFGEKSGVLPHCFVPDWYGVNSAAESKADGPVTILHTGHFYGARTPMPIFRAAARLNSEAPMTGKLKIVMYGGMAEEDQRFVSQNGLSSIVEIHGTIPYLESLEKMRSADYALLVEAPPKLLTGSVFLPSKLVDYLGSGKPILGITPLRGTSARVLKETGHIACDVEDGEGIYQLLKRAACRQIPAIADPAAAGRYHYLNTAAHLSDILNRVVAPHRR